jgi:hypothetical protein
MTSNLILMPKRCTPRAMQQIAYRIKKHFLTRSQANRGNNDLGIKLLTCTLSTSVISTIPEFSKNLENLIDSTFRYC